MSASTQLKTYLRIGLENIFGRVPSEFKKVPIIINNYNRLSTLKMLIENLEKRGYYNIHILDNVSTYPPLLYFYKGTKYTVHHLKQNYGSKALWKSGIWYKFINTYFVYTDSDINLIDDCPDDFMEHFYKILKKYPMVHKIGFSIKIDDLPDHYTLKNKVIDWEKRYYEEELEDNLYIAPLDTTFALYRPFSRRGKRDGSDKMLRTGYPYQIRHMPWYQNSDDLSDEDNYYVNSVTIGTHWSRQNSKNSLK